MSVLLLRSAQAVGLYASTMLRWLCVVTMERDKSVKSANFHYQTYASQRGNSYARSALHFVLCRQQRERWTHSTIVVFHIWIIPSKVLLWEAFCMRSHVSAELRWPQNRIARKNAKNAPYFVVFMQHCLFKVLECSMTIGSMHYRITTPP